MVEHVITPLRGLVIKELIDRGYSQSRIAKIMGITQPAVNRYVSMNRSELINRLIGVGLSEDWVRIIVGNTADLISSGMELEALEYLTRVLTLELGMLRFCEAHRAVVPSIPKDCSICSMLLTGIEDSVVRNVERAIKILENEPGTHLLVPRVLMNIVEAKPGARSLTDVVGVPGRISVVGSKIRANSRPTYGGSSHLGKLVIRLMSINPSLRSVASISYTERVEEAMRRANLSFTKVGPHGDSSEDSVISSVIEALKRDSLDAVIDLGGYGLEPITYIVGMDSVDVAMKIVKVASRLLEIIREATHDPPQPTQPMDHSIHA